VSVAACHSEAEMSPTKRAARNAYNQEAKRTATPTPKCAGFSTDQWDDGFIPSWYPQSSWRLVIAGKNQDESKNDLLSGAACVVERCKAINEGMQTATATTTSLRLELLLPQLFFFFSSSSSSSSCSSPEHAPDASVIHVYPYFSELPITATNLTIEF
jgi:hypothetical protein